MFDQIFNLVIVIVGIRIFCKRKWQLATALFVVHPQKIIGELSPSSIVVDDRLLVTDTAGDSDIARITESRNESSPLSLYFDADPLRN